MNANFVIMGLPASGKTTFLAALWHLVEAGETDCHLVMDGYQGDLNYLTRIADAWRAFEPVPRTSQVGDTDVLIHLRNRITDARGTVFFPDLAGETFDLQVEERRCRADFFMHVDDEDGILFFINADVKDDSLTITELNARLNHAEGTLGALDLPEQDESKTEGDLPFFREWEPKAIPAQVKIVQLLSDFLRAPFAPRRRRLAVLISAWDLARDQNRTPGEWLAGSMPLVDQFLKTNRLSFQARIYGVSAQGVQLKDDTAVDAVANLTPSKRIQIVGPEGEGNDLTGPLVWLMSADE
jgi:hypothetical protein